MNAGRFEDAAALLQVTLSNKELPDLSHALAYVTRGTAWALGKNLTGRVSLGLHLGLYLGFVQGFWGLQYVFKKFPIRWPASPENEMGFKKMQVECILRSSRAPTCSNKIADTSFVWVFSCFISRLASRVTCDQRTTDCSHSHTAVPFRDLYVHCYRVVQGFYY